MYPLEETEHAEIKVFLFRCCTSNRAQTGVWWYIRGQGLSPLSVAQNVMIQSTVAASTSENGVIFLCGSGDQSSLSVYAVGQLLLIPKEFSNITLSANVTINQREASDTSEQCRPDQNVYDITLSVSRSFDELSREEEITMATKMSSNLTNLWISVLVVSLLALLLSIGIPLTIYYRMNGPGKKSEHTNQDTGTREEVVASGSATSSPTMLMPVSTATAGRTVSCSCIQQQGHGGAKAKNNVCRIIEEQDACSIQQSQDYEKPSIIPLRESLDKADLAREERPNYLKGIIDNFEVFKTGREEEHSFQRSCKLSLISPDVSATIQTSPNSEYDSLQRPAIESNFFRQNAFTKT